MHRLKTVNGNTSIWLVIGVVLGVFAAAPNVEAEILWNWSWGQEAGEFLTDGVLVGGVAPPGTYNILDFRVTGTGLGAFGAVVGSISGGDYDEGSQPGQGFTWDGTADTQWFRNGGLFTNGSNFYPTSAAGSEKYTFALGFYFYDDFDEITQGQSSTISLVPMDLPTPTKSIRWGRIKMLYR